MCGPPHVREGWAPAGSHGHPLGQSAGPSDTVAFKRDEAEEQGEKISAKEGIRFKNKRGDIKTREIILQSLFFFLSVALKNLDLTQRSQLDPSLHST